METAGQLHLPKQRWQELKRHAPKEAGQPIMELVIKIIEDASTEMDTMSVRLQANLPSSLET